MRSFEDDRGGRWQAALMEASFGNVLLIFTRIGADGVLHKALDTANFREAETLLADAGETRLLEWLGEAAPWG